MLERIATQGRDGKFLPAYTGEETDAELRELILHFTENCSVEHSRPECVFRSLTGLTHASLEDLVNGLSREACLQLLADECACRNLCRGHNCQLPPNS